MRIGINGRSSLDVAVWTWGQMDVKYIYIYMYVFISYKTIDILCS
jgi:hypothetical protein